MHGLIQGGGFQSVPEVTMDQMRLADTLIGSDANEA